jgi:hypothetical protein
MTLKSWRNLMLHTYAYFIKAECYNNVYKTSVYNLINFTKRWLSGNFCLGEKSISCVRQNEINLMTSKLKDVILLVINDILFIYKA